MKVAIIQIAPVFLDSNATWSKLKLKIIEAANEGALVITWGETLIPGYPQWISPSGGAKFNDPDQKKVYAKYVQEAMTMDGPIVTQMKEVADQENVILIGGIAERYSGSTYCTLLTIGSNGSILSRHRKIKPTFEERLVWADGDSEGLVVHDTLIGKIGSLNCWENWIPYCRAVLHEQEEMIHVAVWPGSIALTENITKFMALEGRSYIISASGLLRSSDFDHLDSKEFPMKEVMKKREIWQNGGSMIVDPQGEIIAGPLIDEEGILYADLDRNLILRERQNFDYSGHYARPDIFDLQLKS